MKALIIADDKTAIERFSAVLKDAGYDIIVYHWLVKAVDNIEEIAPHLILVSAVEYPRHWKLLTQYAESGISGIIPQIILFTEKNFSEEEQKKAKTLGIRGWFSAYDVDGLDALRAILKKKNDIFEGSIEHTDNTETDTSNDVASEIKQETITAPSVADETIITTIPNEPETTETIEPTVENIIDNSENSVEKNDDTLETSIAEENYTPDIQETGNNEQDVTTVADSPSETEELPAENIEEEEPVVNINDDAPENVIEESPDSASEISEECPIEEIGSEEVDKDEINEPSSNVVKDETINATAIDSEKKSISNVHNAQVDFILTNPIDKSLVTGKVINYDGEILNFTPDYPIEYIEPENEANAALKIGPQITFVHAKIIENNKTLKIRILA